MAEGDRERWNARYRAGDHREPTPSAVLVQMASWLPAAGRALVVAGGVGANAVWLAERGLDVTVVDISEVALGRAVAHAVGRGVDVGVVALDLEDAPLPEGPWDLVLCSHYLQRSLIPRVAERLADGGRLLWIHPTVHNLERHPRPGPRFLLQPGEAEALVREAGLEVRMAEEGWVGPADSARCLARVVAQRCG